MAVQLREITGSEIEGKTPPQWSSGDWEKLIDPVGGGSLAVTRKRELPTWSFHTNAAQILCGQDDQIR